jgi:hypothetical protein
MALLLFSPVSLEVALRLLSEGSLGVFLFVILSLENLLDFLSEESPRVLSA